MLLILSALIAAASAGSRTPCLLLPDGLSANCAGVEYSMSNLVAPGGQMWSYAYGTYYEYLLETTNGGLPSVVSFQQVQCSVPHGVVGAFIKKSSFTCLNIGKLPVTSFILDTTQSPQVLSVTFSPSDGNRIAYAAIQCSSASQLNPVTASGTNYYYNLQSPAACGRQPTPPVTTCTQTSNLTTDCDGTLYSINQLEPQTDSLVYLENEDGTILILDVQNPLPINITIADRTCILEDTDVAAALLYPNGDCVEIGYLPGTQNLWAWQLVETTPQQLQVTMTALLNSLTLNIWCDENTPNAQLLQMTSSTDFDHTVLMTHCSACSSGCVYPVQQCSPLHSLTTTCEDITYDLQTLIGSSSNVAFDYVEPTGSTAYFFNLITGLATSTTIGSYTCSLGQANHEYFLAYLNTNDNICTGLVEIDESASWGITYHPNLIDPYLEIVTTISHTAYATLLIYCNPSTQYADVYNINQNPSGNLTAYIQHCSTCPSGCSGSVEIH